MVANDTIASLLLEMIEVVEDNLDYESAKVSIFEGMIEVFERYDPDSPMVGLSGVSFAYDHVLREKYGIEDYSEED